MILNLITDIFSQPAQALKHIFLPSPKDDIQYTTEAEL